MHGTYSTCSLQHKQGLCLALAHAAGWGICSFEASDLQKTEVLPLDKLEFAF